MPRYVSRQGFRSAFDGLQKPSLNRESLKIAGLERGQPRLGRPGSEKMPRICQLEVVSDWHFGGLQQPSLNRESVKPQVWLLVSNPSQGVRIRPQGSLVHPSPVINLLSLGPH